MEFYGQSLYVLFEIFTIAGILNGSPDLGGAPAKC
jgi:hypothetical protein